MDIYKKSVVKNSCLIHVANVCIMQRNLEVKFFKGSFSKNVKWHCPFVHCLFIFSYILQLIYGCSFSNSKFLCHQDMQDDNEMIMSTFQYFKVRNIQSNLRDIITSRYLRV